MPQWYCMPISARNRILQIMLFLSVVSFPLEMFKDSGGALAKQPLLHLRYPCPCLNFLSMCVSLSTYNHIHVRVPVRVLVRVPVYVPVHVPVRVPVRFSVLVLVPVHACPCLCLCPCLCICPCPWLFSCPCLCTYMPLSIPMSMYVSMSGSM
jgi:hypothetical protein